MQMQPFQSPNIARCSTIRNILSCCGKCENCCFVIGLSQRHSKDKILCYWMVWLIIALLLLFGTGYGITMLFNNKFSNPINRQVLPTNPSIYIQNKQLKGSAIIQPLITSDKPKKQLILNKSQQITQPSKKEQEPITQPEPIVQNKVIEPIIQNKIVQPIVSTQIYRPKIREQQIIVKPQQQKPSVIFVPIQTRPQIVHVVKQRIKIIKEKPKSTNQQIIFLPLVLNKTQQKSTKNIAIKQKTIQKHRKRNDSVSTNKFTIDILNSTIQSKNQIKKEQKVLPKVVPLNLFTSSLKDMNNLSKKQEQKMNKNKQKSLSKKQKIQRAVKIKHINRLPKTIKTQYKSISKSSKKNSIRKR